MLPEGYPIELEWQHLKKDELASKSFDDELDASLMPSLREFKQEEKKEITVRTV